MNNIGLRNHSKNITEDLPYGKAYVNLCPAEANVIFVIPLIEEMGISYVFNYLSSSENGTMGKGGNISLYKSFNPSTNKITNADYSIDGYVLDSENKETGMTLRKKDIDRYGLSSNYELEDEQGNKIVYASPLYDYPSEYIDSSGEKTTINRNTDSIIVEKQNLKTSISILGNGTVGKILFYKDGVLTKTAELFYRSQFLEAIKYTNQRGGVVTININHSIAIELRKTIEYIKVTDSVSKKGIAFAFDDAKVAEISPIASESVKKYVGLSYDETSGITLVKDWLNQKEYYFFESRLIDNKTYYFNTLYMNDAGVVSGNDIDDEFSLTFSYSYDKPMLDAAILKQQELWTNNTQLKVTNQFELDLGFYSAAVVNDLNIRKTLPGAISGGNGGDTFVMTCIAKALEGPCEMTGFINEQSATIKLTDGWKMLCVKMDIDKSLTSKIKIGLSATGKIALMPLNLFKNSFANFYTYASSSQNSNSIKCENNVVSSFINDGIKYGYEYDEHKNLKCFKASNGMKVDYEYDDENRITKQAVTGKWLTSITTTEYEGDKVKKTCDEMGSKEYTYDSFGSIETIKNALGIINKVTNRDVYGNITDLELCKEEDSTSVHYDYDSKGRILGFKQNRTNTTYQFDYDEYDRITRLLLNEECIFKYEYNSDGTIKKQYYGDTSDYYEFTYNNKKMVTELSYPSQNIRYIYNYDVYGRLIEIKENRDGTETVLEQYCYDEYSQIIKNKNSTKDLEKITDNLGKEIRAKNTLRGKRFTLEYDTVEKSRSSNPEMILEEITSNQKYSVAPFVETCDCLGANGNYACLSRINNEHFEGPTYVADGIRGAQAESRIAYVINTENEGGRTSKTIAFWFNVSSKKDNGCILHIRGEGNKPGLAVYEKDSDHFELVKINERNEKTILIKTDSNCHYDTDKWNFLSLSVDTGPVEGVSGRYEIECALQLNSAKYKSKQYWNYWECGAFAGPLCVNIGYYFDFYANEAKDMFRWCYFSLIAIGDYEKAAENAISSYYRKTKSYVYDNNIVIDYGNDDYFIVDFSSTILREAGEENPYRLKIYPLENNVFSLDYDQTVKNAADLPAKFDLLSGLNNDGDKLFDFNIERQKYAFVSEGNKLSYKATFGDAGTILASFYFSNSNEKQFLFDVKSNKVRLGFFCGDDGFLSLENNGVKYKTNISTVNGWNDIALSFENLDISNSTVGSKKFKVYCNGSEDSITVPDCEINLGSVEIMLGRCFDSKESNSVTDGGTSCFPLYGLISNFAYSNIYCSKDVLNTILSSLNSLTKNNYYDDFGLIRREEISKGSVTILNKRIEYSDSSHLEVESFGHFLARVYSYDAVGNVTNIEIFKEDSNYNTIRENVAYEYDYRGFLTKETHNDVTYSYEYDDNGNIKKRNSDVFVYDPNSPDKLSQFNNKSIRYDTNAPGNISSFGDWNYEYEGRRLVKATYTQKRTSGSAVATRSKRVIEFKYNDRGLRISKVVSLYKESGPISMPSVELISRKTISFEYDGDALIYEKSNDKEIFYLYDENRQLFGYILNGNKYFYVKDFLNNILGLVDENGQIVAKYNHDAYGNLLSSEGNVYNPIMYKGYYYDSELNMYYCHSRYYVPELCRWLNADNPNFLKFDGVVSTNLFAYCNNNPVMYIDPTGRIAFFVVTLIAGAILGAAIAYSNAKKNGLRGGDAVIETVKGAIVGGLIGAAVGFFISAAATGSLVATGAQIVKGFVDIYHLAKATSAFVGFLKVVDNLTNAIFEPAHVFWSGGDDANMEAVNIAKEIGGITIGETNVGFYLSTHPLLFNDSNFNLIWSLASQGFANQVANNSTVFAIINAPMFKEDSIFAVTEVPTLINKGVEIIRIIIGCM